ncbi:beta strand repeat-containing protein, partial [Flavobacterium sp.]|uniref:beta strand repeat-containing protein n=1 Tax=Flavobacterium sp. TaxID=239 RepID=UPI003751A22F
MRKFYTLVLLYFTIISFGYESKTTNLVWTSALPANMTVECLSVPSATPLTASSTSGGVSITFNEVLNQGICPGQYQLIRSWTATDNSGETIIHTQTVSVQDTTSPILIGNSPLNVTVNSNSIPLTPTLSFTDNCSGNVLVNFNSTTSAVDNFGNYTIIRNWTATDACGNSTLIIQTINIINSQGLQLTNDKGIGINGLTGGTSLTNVMANDTFNGIILNPTNYTASFVSSNNSGVSLNGNSVTVAAGTSPGNYLLIYKVIENANPNNFKNAVASVTVKNSTIIASDDISNVPLATFNVLTNDSINGLQANASNVTITTINNTTDFTINSNGEVSTLSGPPTPYFFIINYQICETANPNNCSTATLTKTNVTNILANPTIVSITQPTCNLNTGSVALSNLPSTGNWILNLNGNPVLIGTGTTATLSNLHSGNNVISVTNSFNSTSQGITVAIAYNEGISVTIFGNYQDYNNDGFTNVGDVINYNYTITNNTCVDAISNITLTSQLESFNQTITLLAANSSDTTTFTSTYVLTQNDINNGFVNNTAVVTGFNNGNQVSNDAGLTTPLAISNGILLNAFLDTNGNGVQNNGEQSFNYGNYTYQVNNGTQTSANSNNNGVILYESNPANSYNITFSVYPFYASQYTVAPASYSNITVANNSGITTYNFPLTATPFNDLAVFMYQSGAPPRPGFTYVNQIQYTNYGTQTIASGTVTFTNSPVVTVLSTSQAGSVITAYGFTYNFTNLLPGETRYMFVTMQVPTIPTVSLEQLVTNTVAITIPSADINTSNNSFVLTQVIVGSYDPNDKTEAHGGKIVHSTFTSNDYLTYTIQFENTGTADAINIRVNDVLDAKLDETSLRMINVSHPYVLQRVGTNLNWKFDGVNLPPSNGSETVG